MKPIPPDEQTVSLEFPYCGLDLSRGYERQKPRMLPNGDTGMTTPVGRNVRAYDPGTQRMRGGQRPGLQKYIAGQLNGTALIQELNAVVGVGFNSPGTTPTISVVQNSSAGGTGGATTVTSTFTGSVVSGNTIVVTVNVGDVAGHSAAQATSVTDSMGNVYLEAVGVHGAGDGTNLGGGSGTNCYVSIWYSVNVIGGTIAVTVHFPSAVGAGAIATEISGLSLTPLDQTNSSSGIDAPASTGSITTTANVEIMFSMVQVMIGINESQTIAAAGGSWTNISNSVGSRVCARERQTTSSSGTYSAAWNTFSNTGHGWCAAIASFRAAAAVPPQTSQSGRVVTLVGVSQGVVKVVPSGGTSWIAVTNSTGHSLNTTGVVRSASAFQKLYFADGSSWLYYDPADNSMHNWTAGAGSLPVGSDGGTPRLICLWRGRVILSGLVKDAQNYFASRAGDPTDWNAFPTVFDATAPFDGNSAPTGLVGDLVNTLIPYSDDLLIIGGDSSIWQFQGDPANGGSLVNISSTIGMAWGSPWCRGPDGTLYFFSNKMGIYSMLPGQPPVRMSQPIDQVLYAIDSGLNIIRMIWDDQWQGLHVFSSLASASAAATHYFWESRTGAWWEDVFPDNNFNPLCCVTFDGNLPSDRRSLIGSWDGYIRTMTPASLTDDSQAMTSSVILGPLLSDGQQEFLCKDILGLLGLESGTVTYQVLVGPSAQKALTSTPVATGTWSVDSDTGGRQLNAPVREAGHAVWVKLTATNYWAMESVKARFTGRGKVRARTR